MCTRLLGVASSSRRSARVIMAVASYRGRIQSNDSIRCRIKSIPPGSVRRLHAALNKRRGRGCSARVIRVPGGEFVDPMAIKIRRTIRAAEQTARITMAAADIEVSALEGPRATFPMKLTGNTVTHFALYIAQPALLNGETRITESRRAEVRKK